MGTGRFPFLSRTFQGWHLESFGYHLPVPIHFNEGTGRDRVSAPMVWLAVAPAFLAAKEEQILFALVTATGQDDSILGLLCIFSSLSGASLPQRYTRIVIFKP